MKETRKAMIRRFEEDKLGIFPWLKLFKGEMIDVGPGDDPLPFEGVNLFDQQDGDANRLSDYFPAESFDLLHASQCLEHMHDPRAALKEWMGVVKPGGHLIVSVPCMELYGDILWTKNGSRYNDDHKSTWSMGLKRSGAPIHVYVPEFLEFIQKELSGTVLLSRVVDTNYDYTVGFTKDQTLPFEARVEAFIEIVLRKK